MSYLVVTREFPPQDGGIANVAFEMAKHLSRRGTPVHVLTWNYRRDEWPENFRDEDQPFRITRIPKPSRRLLQVLILFWAALGIARKRGVKRMIATTWNFSGVAAALLSLCLGIPFIILTYGYDVSPAALTAGDKALMRFAFSRAGKVFASSRHTVKLILRSGADPEKVQFLPLGVDLKRFDSPDSGAAVRKKFGLEGKKVLLTVARLFPRKGHRQVLLAMPEILAKVPDLFYLIAGLGPEKEALEKKIAELGLEDRVAFAGYVPNDALPAYYAACDAFILPNKEITDPRDPWVGNFEGFGIVFIEAAAAGKPVIAGRSGGAPDAVLENVTGLLVNPDDVREIAETAALLLTDEALAKKLGEGGRLRAQRELDWPVLWTRYEKAFESPQA